jgi:dTDP-4-dehydrorhamnose reductase
VSSRKILLFGASGQLGQEIHRVLEHRGYSVDPVKRADGDLTRPVEIAATIARVAPFIVINAAAYNLVDQAEREPEAAYAINGLAVGAMAQECRKIGARFVHYSTDYVFDGAESRPYTEEDPPHPISAYGVSKLAGEMYARAYVDDALVIRVCGVFGPAGRHTPRGNFPETMLKNASHGKPLRVVNDAIVAPTYAPAIAERTAVLIEKEAAGLFHLCGGDPVTWYDYAQLLFELAGLAPEIHAATHETFVTAARRPRYSVMSNAKIEALGIEPMPPLRRALTDFLAAR